MTDLWLQQLIRNAQSGLKSLERLSQLEIDELVTEMAYVVYKTENAKKLAEYSVEDTNLGNVDDKIIKNQRKTLGLLNDLRGVKSTGLVHRDELKGISTYLKPVGIIGAMTPSTNPAATPANHAINAVKGKNAIIICPSPAGYRTAELLQSLFLEVFAKHNVSSGVFQIVPKPINLNKAEALSKAVDLLFVTGNQSNVRKGYSSGTPCLGVGKGNVPVIIDKDANLDDAAQKIAASKIFDNATSCSSENSVVILEDVFDDFMQSLENAGGQMVSKYEKSKLTQNMFNENGVNPKIVGKSMAVLCKQLSIPQYSENKRFLMVELQKIGVQEPLSGEKLSLVLAVYKARDFEHAISICSQILDYEGLGHSVGIHTKTRKNAEILAERMKVGRVLINQAHTFGNGGGFDNYLPFSLSMGCGTWGQNSFSENLALQHYVNTSYLVEQRSRDTKTAEELFSELMSS